MILSSFSYKESGWELVELAPLSSVNLLVGKNATGKSLSLRAIHNITTFLQMKDYLMDSRSFEANLTFISQEAGDWKLEYSFKINEGVVEKEVLTVGDETLITRSKTGVKYKDETINPPSDKLVAQIRRDKDQFPEIEMLMLWAEGVVFVNCSEINAHTLLDTGKVQNVYSFSHLVDSLSATDHKMVLDHAQTLGFNISSIKTVEAVKGVRLVQIKEKSVANEMIDAQLSNGMLRTLYLLCFASVMKHNKKLSMLLIDDLGEGLDYRRSVALGKIIFDDCKQNGVQLIVCSNDAFLMDIVDIDHWQVLSRKNSRVTTINSQTHPGLFREFRMTGLSNFDLFSSDFIDSYLKREGK